LELSVLAVVNCREAAGVSDEGTSIGEEDL
jgi:hypothetical protein